MTKLILNMKWKQVGNLCSNPMIGRQTEEVYLDSIKTEIIRFIQFSKKNKTQLIMSKNKNLKN